MIHAVSLVILFEARVLLFVPSPICSVPELMVIPPPKLSPPVLIRNSVPAPLLFSVMALPPEMLPVPEKV